MNVNARKVLTNSEACEKAFNIEINAQDVIELVDFMTDAAIKGGEETVPLPTAWAAAAVLVLRGRVKRTRGAQRKSWRQKRREIARRIRNKKPADDPMIVWARNRMREIKDQAKSRHRPITAGRARELAAKDASVKFGSTLSNQGIADRMQRPSRYTPSQIQPD